MLTLRNRRSLHRRRQTIFAALLLTLASACTSEPSSLVGQWIGDVTTSEGATRIQVTVDSTGDTALVALPRWQVDSLRATRVAAAGDTVAFVGSRQGDTLRLTRATPQDPWRGAVSHGARRGTVEMVRHVTLSEGDRRMLVGTYRTEHGGVMTVAPFSEFGPNLMLIDYETGRLGPLHPIGRDRFLVGRALIAPTLPADSLTVIRTAGGAVERIRVVEPGRVTTATRLPTSDEALEFASGTVRLAGTLVKPTTAPPWPAIVLVHGSNAQTRDAVAIWARFFVAQGFAVLAYDKRGTGRSTGDWQASDFHALADDAMAGVQLLTTRDDIRRDRIGLWGISQAGWILPLVASRAPADVAFLVVHAGTGATVREQGIHNVTSELRAAGLPEPSVSIGRRYMELNDVVTATGKGFEALQRYYDEHRTQEAWLWPPPSADDPFRAYYRMLMEFNPAPFWRRVRCPVLLFFGELDVNVPPAVSWPPMERALRAGGNAQVTHVILPKANHVFLEAQTGGRDEYPALSRFVPGYFDHMREWLAAFAQ